MAAYTIISMLDQVRIWRQRRQERQRAAELLEMTDHILRDVGFDRVQLVKDVGKPFWRT
jgi:uncharacterized protein YjiS (DUF1127 family)